MQKWKISIQYSSWSACGQTVAAWFEVCANNQTEAQNKVLDLFNRTYYGTFLGFGLCWEVKG